MQGPADDNAAATPDPPEADAAGSRGGPGPDSAGDDASAAAGAAANSSGAEPSGPPLPPGPPTTRVDRWLWAVRLTKTRAEAAQACRGGHVRVNDRTAKPATSVSPGDSIRLRRNGVTRIIEVRHVIDKRVGAPVAVRCLIDHTPPPPPEATVPTARRPRGAGRPTKRERRQLDRLRRERG